MGHHRIKNWDQFQHYKSGKNAAKRPEWIRLYTRLLDDIEFHELAGDDAKALVMLWALASERDGDLPAAKTIAFRLRRSEEEISHVLGRLSHWIDPARREGPRTDGTHGPRTEETREEKRGVESDSLSENPLRENDSETDSLSGQDSGTDSSGGDDVTDEVTGDRVAFAGSYVRSVTQKTAHDWLRNFDTLDLSDLRTELALCDEYYAGQTGPPKNWFFTAMAWIKREHDRRRKLEREENSAQDRIYRGVL